MGAAEVSGLNYCPLCGRKFAHHVEIHGHPGITTSNLAEDFRDERGLVFSYAGMIAQLRMMGYLVGESTDFIGKTAIDILADSTP